MGLYRVLNAKATYVDPPVEYHEPPRATACLDVDITGIARDRFTITGPAAQVKLCLERAYDLLISTYYDISSQKQREGREGFYYDSENDQFVAFPKKRPIGAVLLLFDKAGRTSAGEEGEIAKVPWLTQIDRSGNPKRKVGLLPPSHAHLQQKLDHFLKQENLKAGPDSGLLIDHPYQIKPKVKINVVAGKSKGLCFITGHPETALEEAKGTAFPLLGGSRSFVNGTIDNLRLGWKIDFVGKFVPAVGFFYQQGEDLHIFFPESNDLRRIDELADRLVSMVHLEPNLFRNFDLLLGYYVQRRSEVALSFLHRVFVELSKDKAVQRQARLEQVLAPTGELEPDEDELEVPSPEQQSEPEEVPAVSYEAVFEALRRRGEASFTIVAASKKGKVWMARDFTTFRDIDRLARLFEAMQKPLVDKSGRGRVVCDPRKLFLSLVDFDAKNESRSLLRDKVCEAIFRREGLLSLLERHAFHVNSHSEPAKMHRVGALLDFAKLYEVDLRKGTNMESCYQSMVKTATWLGDTIGKALADAVQGKVEDPDSAPVSKESIGRAKGGLFRLRKSRTVADFVNELARLQLRYGIDVPKDVLDGETFTPELFEEFRGFCVVAALNRFQYSMRRPASPTPQSQSPQAR